MYIGDSNTRQRFLSRLKCSVGSSRFSKQGSREVVGESKAVREVKESEERKGTGGEKKKFR